MKAIVMESITQIHAVRDRGTRLDVLETLFALLEVAPSAALYPRTWMRVGLGMLPASVIRAIRRWRRRGSRIKVESLPSITGTRASVR